MLDYQQYMNGNIFWLYAISTHMRITGRAYRVWRISLETNWTYLLSQSDILDCRNARQQTDLHSRWLSISQKNDTPLYHISKPPSHHSAGNFENCEFLGLFASPVLEGGTDVSDV